MPNRPPRLVDPSPPIGVIAGGGLLPVIIARGIRASGRRVCGIGLQGHFDGALPDLCDEFATARAMRLGQWIRRARRFGVRQAIMVGRVDKLRMHDPIAILREFPDWRGLRVWFRRIDRRDRRSGRVLAAIAEELMEAGVELIDSTRYIPDHLASAGPMNRIRPSAAQVADIAFGWPILRQVAALDIGQSIVARAGDVVAVEAAEGTDGLIERAGALTRFRGWCLMKTAREGHDLRADVPSVGVATIENLARAGGGCLAVGAGRVILLDRPAVLAAADRAKIAVVGVPDAFEGPEALAAILRP